MRTIKNGPFPIKKIIYYDGVMEMTRQYTIRNVVVKDKHGEVIKSGPQLITEKIFNFIKK